MLCIVKTCRALGHHAAECYDDTCRGCQPRLAGDGLYLCLPHVARLGDDILRAAEMYDELAEQLAPTGHAGGQAVSGTRDRGLKFNPRAAESRTAILAVMRSWARLVVDERGFTAPADTVPAMAAFLTRPRMPEWLAAYPAADDAADEFRELAHGEPWRVAYPAGARVFPFSPCPVWVDDDHRCAGQLHAVMRRAESPKRSEIVCNVGDHRWEPHQWPLLRRQLVGQGLPIGTLRLGAVA